MGMLKFRNQHSLASLSWLEPTTGTPLFCIECQGWQTQTHERRIDNNSWLAASPCQSPDRRRSRSHADGNSESSSVPVGLERLRGASNGQEAVEKALQFQPDVIIMDVTMPVMNGLEAARQIAKARPHIPVILFSMHVSDDLYQHLQCDGIRGAVAKTDAARDLAQAVETVLGGGTFFPARKVATT